jgi:hypothetical protein
MIATTDPHTAACAAALFVSDLSTADHPTDTEVAAAIQDSLRTHGGAGGCAADVAASYGDHPSWRHPGCAGRDASSTTCTNDRSPAPARSAPVATPRRNANTWRRQRSDGRSRAG